MHLSGKDHESVSPSPVPEDLFRTYTGSCIKAIKAFEDFENKNKALVGGDGYKKKKKEFLLPPELTNSQR